MTATGYTASFEPAMRLALAEAAVPGPGGADADIPVPADDELDQVLPAGDMSIFADLGLDEMELGAVSADLDLYPEDAVALLAERLRFGDAVDDALDRALSP